MFRSRLIATFLAFSFLAVACGPGYRKPLAELNNPEGFPQGSNQVRNTNPNGGEFDGTDSQIDQTTDSNPGSSLQDSGSSGVNSGGDYYPTCSQTGIQTEIYTLQFFDNGNTWGYQQLSLGNGYTCLTNPRDSTNRYLPDCRIACGGEAQNPQSSWGWCRNSTGFSCRI